MKPNNVEYLTLCNHICRLRCDRNAVHQVIEQSVSSNGQIHRLVSVEFRSLDYCTNVMQFFMGELKNIVLLFIYLFMHLSIPNCAHETLETLNSTMIKTNYTIGRNTSVE